MFFDRRRMYLSSSCARGTSREDATEFASSKQSPKVSSVFKPHLTKEFMISSRIDVSELRSSNGSIEINVLLVYV